MVHLAFNELLPFDEIGTGHSRLKQEAISQHTAMGGFYSSAFVVALVIACFRGLLLSLQCFFLPIVFCTSTSLRSKTIMNWL